MPPAPSTLRIGSRGSPLALWQTNHVAALLRAAHPGLKVEIEILSTKGDRVLDTPLPLIGGKGLFTAELESALHDKRIDLAVHSLKDLPTENPQGLTLAAIPKRADPRDALISQAKISLKDLPQGAVVGTSSLRRIAQLKRLRPDLTIKDIRGNVDTRIKKCVLQKEYDAILLACAGLDRLGLDSYITERIGLPAMLPAPGQAALALQSRPDPTILALLTPLNDPEAELTTLAERTFLAGLGGGCSLPIATLATFQGSTLTLQTRVTSPSGDHQIDLTLSAPVTTQDQARALGHSAAQQSLAQGAAKLLSNQ